MAPKKQILSTRSTDILTTATNLHSLAIHLLRTVRAQDRTSGIGPAQLSALSVLVFGGQHSLGELANAEQVRPPTMSRIVAGLKRTGLVRQIPAADKRTLLLAATPKGTKLLRRAQKRRIAMLAKALTTMNPPEMHTLIKANGLVRRAILRMQHDGKQK